MRARFDVHEYHPGHPVVAAVTAAWQDEYRKAWGKTHVVRGHLDRMGAAQLAHWCELHCQAEGGEPTEVGARIVRNFIAAKALSGGGPAAMAWLDPDGTSYPLNPAVYLEAPAARAARPVRPPARPRGPHPGSASSVHAAEATPLPPGEPFTFDVRVAEIR